MITLADAQRILDHFGGVGKLISFEKHPSYGIAITNQGTYYLLESDPLEAAKTEGVRVRHLKETVGEVTRLLLPDYTGELLDESSYAHHKHMYYSVYKLLNEQK